MAAPAAGVPYRGRDNPGLHQDYRWTGGVRAKPFACHLIPPTVMAGTGTLTRYEVILGSDSTLAGSLGAADGRSVGILQLEDRVKGAGGLSHPRLVHDTGNAYIRRSYHLDIDTVVCEGPE